MRSVAPRAVAVIVLPVIVLFAFVPPTVAQPSLSSLWPVDVGREWEFDVVVRGPFDKVETGVLTQTVVSRTEFSSGVTISCFSVASTLPAAALVATPAGLSALDQRLWFARPDLREKISVRVMRGIVAQPSLLLAVSECVFDVGFLVDEEVAMGSWSDSIADWAWWWITANPAPGSTFRLQIRTEIVDDAFVNGVVRAIEGAVTTAAGSFTNAVIVDYVVELGESTIVDATDGVLGTVSFEIVGWVAFVPDVGPVASEEAFGPARIDCPDCPPAIFETVTTTMDLRATATVSNEGETFGRLKARF